MPNCVVKDCQRPHYARGMCGLHYARLRTTGTIADGVRPHAPAEVRFWRGMNKGAPDECWPYVRGANRGRYGRFQAGGAGTPHVGAHRFSYTLHKGPVPAGLVVMHSCDNPRCVNPAHLSVGTPRENTADMIRKGRHARLAPIGEASGKAVLTEADVHMIRRSSETNIAIATRLGVAINTVRSVRIGRTWAHVKDTS